jgi:Acetoacetate decarboxylase (ADC)
MNVLDRYFAPARGAIREFLGINAIFEPADLRLYERMLPRPFGMPDRPLVSIMAIDYLSVGPWPLTPWQEWTIMLRCAWRDGAGWHPVTSPVTKWLPMSAGRYLGYPKYVADEITIAQNGDTLTARSVHRGIQQLSLHFEPTATAGPISCAPDLLADPALFKGDVYVILPRGTTTIAQRVSMHYVAANWTSVQGSIQFQGDRTQPWIGLVPLAGPIAGQAGRFIGGLNLVAEKLR